MKRSAMATAMGVLLLGLSGCIWLPTASSDDGGTAQHEAPGGESPEEEPQSDGQPEGPLEPEPSILEAPMSTADLEPVLSDAYEGLYETLVLLRRGESSADVLLEYATVDLAERQLGVFGSSIPPEYTLEGFFRVENIDVPTSWERGSSVVAHVCIDDSEVQILDEHGVVVERETAGTFSSATVLFELHPDATSFRVADILNLFPDADDPCPTP